MIKVISIPDPKHEEIKGISLLLKHEKNMSMICLVQMLLPGKNKDALRLLEWVEHGRYPSALLHFDHLHSCEWCMSGRDMCTSKWMLS